MLGRTLGQRRVTAEPLKKGLFERIVGYQQVVVLLAGFAYAFGYASRALNSFDYNLGTLPGIRFEYLVAGTLLLIPPVALCLFFWGVWRSAKELAAWVATVPKRKARVLGVLVGIFLLSFAVAVYGGGWVSILGLAFAISTVPYLVMVLTDERSSPSHGPIESEPVKWWQKLLSSLGHGLLYIWGAILALLFGLLLLLLFALAVGYGAIALKYVPQEFGGVKPKCGVLDLAPDQLSPELRSLIAGGEPLDPSSKVVRSRPLQIFSTGEPWLVRLPSPAAGVPAKSIRLDSKAVLSVEWCP